MRRICFIAALILLLCRVAMAEEIKNYTLDISKVNQEASNLHVKCSFSLDFQNKDSVSMNFGGGQEFSIDNLNINSGEFEYELYLESKSIVFRKVSSRKISVNMTYNYTNHSEIARWERRCELWETSFGEFFYPYVPNTFMDVALNVETPDSLSLICSYPLDSGDTTKYSGKFNLIPVTVVDAGLYTR